MKLRDAKILFDKLRADAGRIFLTGHILRDHPERGFTRDVVLALVMGRGRLVDNKMPSAVAESFMWLCKDAADRPCELVVKFEALQGKPNELVLVISAYRETKK